MKVTPISRTNGAQTSVNPNEGKAAGADRVARAKAAMRGQDPNTIEAPAPTQNESANTIHSIKMKTQATPQDRQWLDEQTTVGEATVTGKVNETVNSDTNEPVQTAPEDKKPLDPRIATLLKRERSAQVKEAELKVREDALKNSQDTKTVSDETKERLKTDAIGFLLDNGVTWDQLTQETLKSTEGGGPALTKMETELRKEIKGLKEALESKEKKDAESEDQATTSALDQMQKQAEKIIAADDTYQLVREMGASKQVRTLIKRVFDETNEIMDVKEALDEIENDLLEQGLKVARIGKVQAKLPQEQIAQQRQVTQTQNGNNTRIMRTLTNRDTVSAVPTAKQRAIAAFHGKKLV